MAGRTLLMISGGREHLEDTKEKSVTGKKWSITMQTKLLYTYFIIRISSDHLLAQNNRLLCEWPFNQFSFILQRFSN